MLSSNSLRTAKDALAVGWPGYDSQAPNYLAAAQAHSLSLIYLSSGNPEDTKRLTATASKKNITVETKDSLLSSPSFLAERKAMEKLTWDHRGIIDFLVLLRSSYFGGMFESSFSWNVANKRHVLVNGGTWITINEENRGIGEGKGPECFVDGLSAIYGPLDMYGIRWQFPQGLFP